MDDYGIRKLTPRECLLFQGFPRNYKIPHNMSDSKIYKQAGNAVSVPVIERIARKIVKTLGEGKQKEIRLSTNKNYSFGKMFMKSYGSLNKIRDLDKEMLSNI